MSLDAWSSRLASHFGELAKKRLLREQTVFALEHGLSIDETKVLERDVRTAALSGAISDKHWLPWVVYATERGYEYSGDEYWQSFEQKTPRWRSHGDRSLVRDWFKRFNQEYRGVKPAGPWADHFTIICWPITHAILPRDLQRYLARVLYQLRHSFNSVVLRDSATLGELIQARSWDASSRFRHLAQHTRLIGEIATALLRPQDDESHYRIVPATLRRIGEDLDRERRARHWLDRARASAEARLQLKGLRRPGSNKSVAIADEGLPPEFVQELGMEPRLLLRPQGDNVWQALLEFPDLSHLRDRFPAMGEVLSNSRCHVAGSIGGPVPRGGFLYGPCRVRLARWPEANEHLLRFEADSAETVWVQSVESLLRPGPRWLAKISADGLARETRGQVCRPGSSYIVCSTSPLGELPCGTRVSLTCSGVEAVRVDIPDVVDSTLARSLRQAGLAVARALEVWPAGIPAASWDGEGFGEWITSQPVCIGVRPDHAVHRLEVECVSPAGETVAIEPEPGETSFLSLPSSWAGIQRIRVTAYSSEGAMPEVGELTVKVRDPREWSAYAKSGAPVWLEKRPSSPTMEQLWKGDAAILVHGPPGWQLRVTLGLLDRDGKTRFERSRGPIGLPLSAGEWRGILAGFRREPKAQRSYDAAHALRVKIDAGLLGRAQLTIERETSPLRWVVEKKRASFQLQLLDDTGRPESVRIWWSDFARPAIQEEVPREAAVAVMEAPQQGGLFLAIADDVSRGVVVAPSGPMKGLRALKADPTIELPARSVAGLRSMIEVAARWSSARPSGDLLSVIRRDRVLARVLQRIFGLIGGERWEQGETEFRQTEKGLEKLVCLVGKNAAEERFAEALLEAVPEMARTSTSERVAAFREITLGTLAVRCGDHPLDREKSWPSAPAGGNGSSSRYLEACLRLASLAHGLEDWGGVRRDAVAAWLLENPVVARGARFVVLGVDSLLDASESSLGHPHPGWVW